MQYTVCVYVCVCIYTYMYIFVYTHKWFLEENSERFASKTLWCAKLELNIKKSHFSEGHIAESLQFTSFFVAALDFNSFCIRYKRSHAFLGAILS